MLFRVCLLDDITYNGRIKAVYRAENIENGLALFKEMTSDGLNPNNIFLQYFDQWPL